MAAPSTMILLDPDLDPDPAPSATAAKRKLRPALDANEDLRLPSARTLARFLASANSRAV